MLGSVVLPILMFLGSPSQCAYNTPALVALPIAKVTSSTVELRSIKQSSVTSSPISLEFSQDVEWRGGKIYLRKFVGEGYETVETFDGNDFGTTSAHRLSITGNTLNIVPSRALETLASYAVRIAPGAVQGASGDPFIGITNDTTLVQTGARFEPPTVDRGAYRHVVENKVFRSTFQAKSNTLYINSIFKNRVEVSNVENVAFVNSTFEDIRGDGISIDDSSDVKISNSTFRNIRGTAILLRRSGSTNNVAIFGNLIENIGGDGIHSAKRYRRNVDHTNLVIYDNNVRDVGTNGGSLYHGIYTQTSNALIIKNRITGSVDGNGISIRGDGLVWGNFVDIRSGRESGSGIKYFSDHLTGPSKKLTIADNVVKANNLASAIELDIATEAIPNGFAPQDWVVNSFRILRNDVDAEHPYVIERELLGAAWTTVDLQGQPGKQKPEWHVR